MGITLHWHGDRLLKSNWLGLWRCRYRCRFSGFSGFCSSRFDVLCILDTLGLFIIGRFFDGGLAFFFGREFFCEFGVRFQHRFQLGIGPTVQPNLRQHFQGIFIFIGFFRGHGIDNVFLEDPNPLYLGQNLLDAGRAVRGLLF